MATLQDFYKRAREVTARAEKVKTVGGRADAARLVIANPYVIGFDFPTPKPGSRKNALDAKTVNTDPTREAVGDVEFAAAEELREDGDGLYDEAEDFYVEGLNFLADAYSLTAKNLTVPGAIDGAIGLLNSADNKFSFARSRYLAARVKYVDANKGYVAAKAAYEP